MKLESLSIAPKQTYSAAGPKNPYIATLRVSYNENTMQVTLGHETCVRILALAGDEIAQAAQIQIQDFVRTAIAVNEMPLIEGDAKQSE